LLPETSARVEALEAELDAARTGGLALRETVQPEDILAIAKSWTAKDITL
jgi:hypothetical protein